MKTNDELLEKVSCCTIEEDADLDVKENFYYKYEDVIKAMNEARQQAPVMLSLPSEEDVFQWAVKKSESFEHNLLARQCFIEGAEYMRKCVEQGNGA